VLLVRTSRLVGKQIYKELKYFKKGKIASSESTWFWASVNESRKEKSFSVKGERRRREALWVPRGHHHFARSSLLPVSLVVFARPRRLPRFIHHALHALYTPPQVRHFVLGMPRVGALLLGVEPARPKVLKQ